MPNHYLSQYLLIIDWAQGNIFKQYHNEKQRFLRRNLFESVICNHFSLVLNVLIQILLYYFLSVGARSSRGKRSLWSSGSSRIPWTKGETRTYGRYRGDRSERISRKYWAPGQCWIHGTRWIHRRSRAARTFRTIRAQGTGGGIGVYQI